jgi:hypothetical protein
MLVRMAGTSTPDPPPNYGAVNVAVRLVWWCSRGIQELRVVLVAGAIESASGQAFCIGSYWSSRHHLVVWGLRTEWYDGAIFASVALCNVVSNGTLSRVAQRLVEIRHVVSGLDVVRFVLVWIEFDPFRARAGSEALLP